nr:postacrosomal sheath WW domain-binding protein isoform X3 [Microcebus murinus]
MAVNQTHSQDRRGVVIAYGESLLMQSPDVELSFPQQPEGSNLFSGTKRGTLVLTSHRVIFLTSRSVNDPMLSFMMPFDLMKNCTVEQPVFAANYIKGTIQAAPDGGWEGQAIFKLVFIRGGAITFAKLMSKAASAVIVYGAPPMGYGTLPPENRAPPMGNEGLPVGNGASPVGYGAPPVGYGAPPVGYGAPPVGYGAPPVGYGAPPVGYGAPPPGYRAPPMGYGAPPAGSVAAQTPENGASLPSTSSQAHSPPSKI